MDPDCAICLAPASYACDCEVRALKEYVKAAEAKMMTNMYNEIRMWVRGQAQDHNLKAYRRLTERRRAAHAQHVEELHAHARYWQLPAPLPQLAAAEASLERAVNEDWRASLRRYPDLLEYYFGLVQLTLPDDADPAVTDPPLPPLPPPTSPRKPLAAGPRASTAAAAAAAALEIGPMPEPVPVPMPEPDPRTRYPPPMMSGALGPPLRPGLPPGYYVGPGYGLPYP